MIWVVRRHILHIYASLLIGVSILAVADEVSDARSQGTIKMAERLEGLRRSADPLKNPFLNRDAARLFGDQLRALLGQKRRSVSQAITLYFKYAYELLHAGENRAAIQQFDALENLIKARRVALSQEKRDHIELNRIMAHLRLGEQENCLEQHTTESCLLPIQESGFHKKPAGSQEAARLLESFLKRHPGNLRAAWLLNIAYMTLGKHPEELPENYLIPEKVFASEYALPRFKDMAGDLGLAWNSLAGSVVMDDFDRDNDLDLMVSGMGLDEQLRLFLNDGDGTFTERTKQSGIVGELGGLNLVQADYDNDGDLDVFVLRGAWFESQGNHPNSLLRNRGDAHFDDVTEEAGLLSYHPTQAATWLDFDGDGWIDLFVGNESSVGARNQCELFHNQKDGTFREIGASVGLSGVGMIKAVGSGDYNNDGRPDLYLSCRGQANFLYRNDGPSGPNGTWHFSNQATKLKVDGPAHSFPSWFFDFDNDGWQDIFSCGYGVNDVGTVAADYLGLKHGAARSRLYRNLGDGTFEDVSREAGLYRLLLGMAGNYGDLDNDGFLDFYIGTGTPQLDDIVPNRMFRNDRGKRFQDVTTAGGFGHIQKGHGIAFGDLDHDGDQDVYTSLGGAYEGDAYFNALFENPGSQNSWIKFAFEGTKSNRAAIGARLKVTVRSEGRTQVIHRVVNSGGSFGSSPLRQEIGLGPDADQVDLEIRWPGSDTRQRFDELEPGHLYLIREESSEAVKKTLAPLKFKKDGNHSHHAVKAP
jgi:hypothetical protein